MNLDEIEARASRRSDSFADREEFNRHARTDVPALIARVRELEAALRDIASGDYSDPFCRLTPEQRARDALAKVEQPRNLDPKIDT